MATIGVKGTITANISASASIPRDSGNISSNSSNKGILLHPRRPSSNHHPFSLPHHPDTTATAPPTARDADEFQAGPPRHDDNGAAVFGADDGADGAVGVGLEEVDAVWRGGGGGGGGFDLDGKGEGVWRRADFFVGGVDGPFWGEALFVSLYCIV